jgi:hypothetical protein
MQEADGKQSLKAQKRVDKETEVSEGQLEKFWESIKGITCKKIH